MAMLRLLKSILSHLLSSASPPSTSALSSLHRSRLLSATAQPASPNPSFVVEDYLVAACGLTRPQALKASTKLSHLSAPSKPDAVLAFLAGLGLSSPDVAALVAGDPQFLCASVEKTLAPRVAELTGLGLSRPEIARLVPLARTSFRSSSLARNVGFWLPFFGGSFDKLLQVVKSSSILSTDLRKGALPNIAFLRECGLADCDIAKLSFRMPRLLIAKPEHVREMLTHAERIGVPRTSGMFRYALEAVAFLSEEDLGAKVDCLKKMLRWSDAEVGIAVSKAPWLLKRSEDMLQRRSKFLISEVGLEPVYIAHRSAMLGYSLESRLRPRYHVLKFLKAKRLLEHDRSYYAAVTLSDKVFMERFIHPYKETTPRLEDYVAACGGEVPARFVFA